MNKINRKKILDALRVVIYVCLLFGLLLFIQIRLNVKILNNQKLINDSWTITVNGENTGTYDLSQYRLSESKRDQIVAISRRMTEDHVFDSDAVAVMLRYSRLKAYMDGQLIFEKNSEAYERGDLLGNGYVWVPLPDDYKGKTLTLEFTLGENNSFNSIEDICLVNASQGQSVLLASNVIVIFVTAAFIVLGLIALVGGLVLMVSDRRFAMLFHIGSFSTFASLWLICNSRIMCVFTDNFTISGTLEYVGLYGGFISMIMFMTSMLKEDERLIRAFRIYGYVLIASFVLIVYLSLQNIMHVNQTVHHFQLVGVLSIIVVAFVLIRNVRKHKTSAARYLLIGLIIFLFFAVLEIFRYRFNRILVPKFQMHASFMPIAVASFIILMFISFVRLLLERVAENIEKEKLYDLAYYDTVTGLKNRAWCERIMRSFEKTNRSVTILNFDLDNFKQVNDTYGHSSGDELLRDFGTCLGHCFRGADCVGRMGGDEFVVILDYMPEEKVMERLAMLSERVEELNATRQGKGEIFFSVGIADNNDQPEVSVWKVYEKSDRFMYQNKQLKREMRE